MPIIRANNLIVYFSHIPKCGGTSVENFLATVTGSCISFLNRRFLLENNAGWTASSPQHITGEDLSKLFSIDFFDEFFTVSRNPIDRFRSAFLFQKYSMHTIPPGLGINEFATHLEAMGALDKGKYDNHFLPQVLFLYPKARYKVFKLENGLGDLKEYIRAILNVDVGCIEFPHSLQRPNRPISDDFGLDENSTKKLRNIYRRDFEVFNY